MLETELSQLLESAQELIKASPSTQQLYNVKVQYLGKTGLFSTLSRRVGELDKSERPGFGKKINEVLAQFEKLYKDKEDELKAIELEERLKSDGQFDPGYSTWVNLGQVGTRHVVSSVIHEIVDIMSRLGFSVRTGPLVESDKMNFEALNIPKEHPARDMQDTFYVDKDHVLRTHTSPVQIHTMMSEKPPLRILSPGATFRVDSDASHSPHFHQIECLLIDKQVSFSDLKGTISYFVKELFGESVKTRFRASYFPFTEPSAEVDCSCPICGGKGCSMCGHSGWIEIGGSGLVHPQVLRNCGLSPEMWQGFAFGFGIERMAVIKHGIDHIKVFTENDLRFLEQFAR